MKLKKMLAAVLTMAMVATALPVTAFADDVIDTEEELSAALAVGGEVVLGGDIEVESTLTVPAGVEATLDLAGFEISMVKADAITKNHELLLNKGDLTIKDGGNGGTISYKYTGTSTGFGNSTNAVTSNPGSTLNVLGGTIENLTEPVTTKGETGGNGIAYAIDILTNAGGGDVTLTVKDGTITSKLIAVRAFANSNTNTTTINIDGGDFVGRVQIHNPNATKTNKAALTITGGTFTANEYSDRALYLYAADGDVTAMTVSVTGGEFDGKVVATAAKKGEFKEFITGGKFTDLAGAVEYAADGATIKLLDDAEGSGIVIDKPITIDFGGNTYDVIGPAVGSEGTTTQAFQILKKAGAVTLKNGTIKERAPEQNSEGETNKAIKMLVQNYANLTVKDMILDGTNLGEGRYVLSNNNGDVTITGKTYINAPMNGVAVDAYDYAPYYDGVTVTFDNKFVGKVNGVLEVDGTEETADAKMVIAGTKGGFANDLRVTKGSMEIAGGSFTDLANAVKYAVDNATITLLKDVEGSGVVVDKNITIDLDGNTYTLVNPAVGSTGTETLGFQLLAGDNVADPHNVVIKDGTIEVGEDNDSFKMLVQNYSNLTLDGVTLDGTKLIGTHPYTLSNNNGDTVITGDTYIYAAANGEAFDLYDWKPYYAGVSVAFKNFTGGVKGGFEVGGEVENEGDTPDATLTIDGGYFTVDPSAYVVEGKGVATSTKVGYNYMVGEASDEVPAEPDAPVVKPEVPTDVIAGAPTTDDVQISGDAAAAGITKGDVVAVAADQEAAMDTLIPMAEVLSNDGEVINNAVIDEARTELNVTVDKPIMIVVQPYIDMDVVGCTASGDEFVLTLDIQPMYRLVATTAESVDKMHEGNSSVVGEAQKMEVTEEIVLTVPVPEGVSGTIWVRHVKDNGDTYFYKAEVSGRTATFTNPNGFSTFTLPGAPVAQVGEIGYETLQDAVDAVENNGTIELLGDVSGETATVSKSITFKVVKNGNEFAADNIVRGNSRTTVTPVEDGDEITFTCIRRSSGGGGGGSSATKYTASVDKDELENGSVSLSKTKAEKGDKVTITVTPDKGYELDELKVVDKDGNKVTVTDNGDGTFTFKMPKGGVEIEASFEESDEEAPVVDEPADEETVLVLTIDQVIYQLNGNYAANDVAPIIKGERTMLPIRLIAEALGATVTWNEAEQAVMIVKGDTEIVIYIGQSFALVNGEPVQLDASAFIANDRTYLPLRFVAENLGAEVVWDGEARTVTIIG